jgi:drug/metabolite transporter (DMT)-like permease
LGILLSVGGAVTMVVGGDTKTTNYTGVLFFVGNTFCSGVYIVLQKPVLKKFVSLNVSFAKPKALTPVFADMGP